jgi:hypothetical protein
MNLVPGALAGTFCGIAAVCLFFSLGILVEATARPEMLILLPFVFLFVALEAAPGAFLLGLPLTAFLRRVRAEARSRIGFFLAAGISGAPLGLVNLLIVSGVLSLLLGMRPQAREMDGLWIPALVGGLGLGLGSGIVVWREAGRRR